MILNKPRRPAASLMGRQSGDLGEDAMTYRMSKRMYDREREVWKRGKLVGHKSEAWLLDHINKSYGLMDKVTRIDKT